jgi:hypothetical protein
VISYWLLVIGYWLSVKLQLLVEGQKLTEDKKLRG